MIQKNNVTENMMKVLIGLVTYNRSALLKRILRLIEEQTYQNWSCLIIDNASTDETPSIATSFNNNKFIYFRNDQNLGGAGGFSLATRAFLASNAEALLLLDDDAQPAPEMLEELVNKMKIENLDVANALVVDETDATRMSFGVWPDTSYAKFLEPIFSVDDVIALQENGVLFGTANPFNGILFKRDLVERIGSVDARMFIWGDEIDYLRRAIQVGAKIGVVCKAYLKHPTNRAIWTNIPFIGKMLLAPDNRAPIRYRNRGYLDAAGRIKPLRLFVRSGKIFLSYIFLRKPLVGIRCAFYYLDGALNTYLLNPSGKYLLKNVKQNEDRLSLIIRQRRNNE